MIGPDGERTIVVLGEPHHPWAGDPLPWDLLARCDAVYFTADDPAALRRARAARVLVATARRRAALAAARVRADAVLGSAADAREVSRSPTTRRRPAALVLTEGARGGRVETANGTTGSAPRRRRPARAAPTAPETASPAPLTFFLAAGLTISDACARAGRHGAAVLPVSIRATPSSRSRSREPRPTLTAAAPGSRTAGGTPRRRSSPRSTGRAHRSRARTS